MYIAIIYEERIVKLYLASEKKQKQQKYVQNKLRKHWGNTFQVIKKSYTLPKLELKRN